jgi:hypothetical protein
MMLKTFLLACFLHVLLFTVLALPEIVSADEPLIKPSESSEAMA